MPNHDDLCDTCSGIEIGRFLTSPVPPEAVELGSWQQIQERSASCRLCHRISTAVKYGPRNYKSNLTQDDELLLTTKATGAHLRDQNEDAVLKRTFRLNVVTDDLEDAGDILLHAEDAHILQQQKLFHGRPLNPRRINTELVRSWVAECRSSHPLCESRPTRQNLGISIPEQSLLVDVHRQCLVDATPASVFAALSYKWGESKQFLTTRNELAQLRQPSELARRPLPRTVRDAITLTRDIGLKYLWVDALCIIQDSDDHEAEQISRMHHIYGGATITIVAASSFDADDGLHGAGHRARNVDTTTVTVDGFRLLARNCFLDVTMNRSEYSKRAWTYQESCLSRRLLYVTSRGTVMHCCQGMRSEEIVLEDTACESTDCSSHLTYLDSSQRNVWREFIAKHYQANQALRGCTCVFNERQRFLEGLLPVRAQRAESSIDFPIAEVDMACSACLDFHGEITAEFHTYKSLVRSYTRRQMRFESDRIPAFSGITGLLASIFDCKFLFGIPEKYLDMALLWRPNENNTGPLRTEGLKDVPSWSWASHEIPAYYSGNTWMTSEVDWYYVDPDQCLQQVRSLKFAGNHAPIREDFHRLVTDDQLASSGFQLATDKPLATLYGWCQVSQSFYIKGLHLYDENQELVDPEWNIVAYSHEPTTTRSDFAPVELCFISRSNHADLIPMAIQQGRQELEEHQINVLIIETNEDVTKRVALATIFNAVLWERCEKEWRLIKLM